MMNPLMKQADAKSAGEPPPRSSETVAHLFRRVRALVEDRVWKEGLVWHSAGSERRISPTAVAESVFPDPGTPAERVCAAEIEKCTGTALSGKEARAWFVSEVERRFGDYIRGAREKVRQVILVVTESSITVRPVRPASTKLTVGTAPWDPETRS